MLSKIFKKKSARNTQESEELKRRIERMNLNELTLYIKGRLESFDVTEDGIVMVLKRLVSKVNENRYFLDEDDDDSKLKKTFDLVLLCAGNSKVTFKAMEYIAEFAELYIKLIKEYDKKYIEIYQERFKKAIELSQEIIEAKIILENKMNMIN